LPGVILPEAVWQSGIPQGKHLRNRRIKEFGFIFGIASEKGIS
jgi:hypothetical protein